MKKIFSYSLLPFFLIILCGICIFIFSFYHQVPKEYPYATSTREEYDVKSLSNNVSSIVKKAIPSVVIIQNKEQNEKEESFGSGFLFSYENKTYVLTNEHVIENLTKPVAIFQDNHEVDLRIVGRDFDADISILEAVNKEDMKGIPTLSLGDMKQQKQGDFVITIGHPLGLEFSSSFGMISGLKRDLSLKERDYEEFIQTDAAINQGNSGGPLLNLQGQVIGMNTAILKESQGLGFAIPSNVLKQAIPDLIHHGKIQHPYIGIYMGMNKENKVYIADVIKNSPADKGGIEIDDIIAKIDGIDVKNMEQIGEYIKKKKIGDVIQFEMIRKDARIKKEVTIGEEK